MELSSTGLDYDDNDSSVDCNDYDSTINPGAYDIPGDGIDQDCDGVDAGTGTIPQTYIGTENYLYGAATYSPGYYDCDMNFSLSGTSTIPCATCDYVDMTVV